MPVQATADAATIGLMVHASILDPADDSHLIDANYEYCIYIQASAPR